MRGSTGKPGIDQDAGRIVLFAMIYRILRLRQPIWSPTIGQACSAVSGLLLTWCGVRALYIMQATLPRGRIKSHPRTTRSQVCCPSYRASVISSTSCPVRPLFLVAMPSHPVSSSVQSFADGKLTLDQHSMENLPKV